MPYELIGAGGSLIMFVCGMVLGTELNGDFSREPNGWKCAFCLIMLVIASFMIAFGLTKGV